MTHILCIETSTKNCSVSLSANEKILGCKELAEDNYSHAENLHVFIQEVIQQSGLKKTDLKAVAISKGPGSYTGLRIGVSAAKGLCYALDLPLIALDTLTILAKQKQISDGLIIPMIDARRMEVYTTMFNKNHQILEPIISKIIDENSFSNFSENLYFIGDGTTKCQAVFSASNHYFDDTILYPSAKEMCAMAFEKFQTKTFEDVAYFEPYYLKEFMMGGK